MSTKFRYDRTFYETDTAYHARLENKEHDPLWFKDYYGAILNHSTPESKILDCGCGTGITTSWLHQQRPHIRGVDFSSAFIESALKRGDYFEVMDAKALNFPDASFDDVCTADAVEHIPDLPKALSEMLRVLKPGGHIIIQCPNLATSVISTNYHVTWRNVVRKLKFCFQDMREPTLRTIEDFELDVKTGDKDAYNLMSPLWLSSHLRQQGCEVMSLTTYATYFQPGRLVGWALKILSVFPITRHFGGRMVLVARKTAKI